MCPAMESSRIFKKSEMRRDRGDQLRSFAAQLLLFSLTALDLTGFGNAAPAPRFIQMVQAMGGTTANICVPSFAAAMMALGAEIFGAPRAFRLSSLPEPTSIQVRLDGMLIPPPALWAYDVATNLIRFTPQVRPSRGAQVQVSYQIACTR